MLSSLQKSFHHRLVGDHIFQVQYEFLCKCTDMYNLLLETVDITALQVCL
jgi:hypothetical protein